MYFDPGPEIRLLPWLSSALGLVMAMLFAWMGTQHPRAHALRWWGAAWLCLSAANAGYALRGTAPDSVSIIMANLLLLAGLLAIHAGALRLNGARLRHLDIPGLILTATVFALLIWFTYQAPDLRARILTVGIGSALLSCRIAVQLSLFAQRRGSTLPAGILAGLWWLIVSILAVTTLATWAYGVSAQNLYQSNPAIFVLLQVKPLLAVLIAGFALWTQLRALNVERARYMSHIREKLRISRAAFDASCNAALALQNGRPLSVALVDLDNFEIIARKHGYETAEAVVKWVENIIRSELRPGDSVELYGNDQYALLLPVTTGDDALLLTQDIRRRVHQGSCPHEGLALTTTVSIGLAFSQPNRNSARAMTAAAKVAMFEARAQGRNRVAIAPSDGHDIALAHRSR